MTEPEVGPNTISPQEREALAAWTAEVARDRQLAVEAKAAAAAKRRRTTTLLGAGLAGVLLLGGAAYGISQIGSDNPDPVAQPSSVATAPAQVSSTAPTSAPSSTPVALTPVQRAEAEAEAAFREYLRVDDAVAQGGYRDTKPYDAVAVSPERPYLERIALESRAAGERQIGELKVRDLSVIKSDLEPGPGNYPYVELKTCIDVRGVDVVNRAGESTVEANRPDFVAAEITVNYYKPGTDGVQSGGWRVYEVKSPGDAC